MLFKPGRVLLNDDRRILERLPQALKRLEDRSWHKIEYMNQKLVRVLDFNSVVRRSLRRKILRIVRDDDIDTAANGRGQYVAIIRIG